MDKEIEICIKKTVGRFPESLRADLSQELWIIALDKMADWDPKISSIKTFLYRPLLGACYNWIAKNVTPHRHEELSPDMVYEDPIDLDKIPDPEPEPTIKDFIADKLAQGYTVREIFYRWPKHHKYRSIQSLYNVIKREG